MSKTNKNNKAVIIESAISDLLNPIFKNHKKDFLIINNLTKNWEDIIGKKYANFCQPKSVKISSNQKLKNLIITSYNSAIGFFLENNSELIINRIANLYGFKVIDKVTIKQEPREIKQDKKQTVKLEKLQEEFLQKITSNCEEDLAKTLINLGREIIGK